MPGEVKRELDNKEAEGLGEDMEVYAETIAICTMEEPQRINLYSYIFAQKNHNFHGKKRSPKFISPN